MSNGASTKPNGFPILQSHPLGPFYLRQQIASGSTCMVYNARSTRSLVPGKKQYLVAVKLIAFDAANPQVQKKIMREVRIHETLKHQNILEMITGEERAREGNWPAGLYIAMQLAAGGDLFDKIPPDVGLPPAISHLYFYQLISGLKYLASQGIVHRDIKPENVLLDSGGNLKITDFGLASVFKYKGKTRLLTDRCGSPPYAAPELAHNAPYSGPPIDVWSAGIVLFALLVGNTPWDEPTQSSPEFDSFVKSEIWTFDPWNRIVGPVKELLLGVLSIDASTRWTIAQIEQHPWFTQYNHLLDESTGLCHGLEVGLRLTEHLRRHGLIGDPTSAFEDLCQEMDATHLASQGQPGGASQGFPMSQTAQNIMQRNGCDPNDAYASSLRMATRLSAAPSQRMNPNITRFFTTQPLEQLVHLLSGALSSIAPPLGPIPHDILQDAASSSAGSNLYLVRLRFKVKDPRGQPLQASVVVSEGYLEADPQSGKDEVRGLDVVMKKKVAEPLEMKRVYLQMLANLPKGVVVER